MFWVEEDMMWADWFLGRKVWFAWAGKETLALAPVESILVESTWFLLVRVGYLVAFGKGMSSPDDVGPSGLELCKDSNLSSS